MVTTTTERINPAEGESAGLQNTATERVLNITKSPSKCQSYEEASAAAATEEYAWIDSERCQELSDSLDRVMKINPYWRNIYLEHGRQTACSELAYKQFNIEMEYERRKEADIREKRQDTILGELYNYLEKREQFKGTYSELWSCDAAFLKEQIGKGYGEDEWLNQFGDTLRREIQKLQSGERFWIADRRRIAERERQERQAEAEKRRMKDEASQRQADKFAKAVTSAAETMLQGMLRDLVASGVLRGK